MGINREEQFLCNALAEVLAGKEPPHPEKGTDMDRVLELAYAHKVHPLLYECSDREEVSAEWRERLKRESRKIVSQNYRLLFLTKYLTSVLEENGIGTAVLKGVGVAQLYPVPELRKSGDIDLLVSRKHLAKAEELMKEAGFAREEEQWTRHHVSYVTKEGISIELHIMLAEEIDFQALNQYMNGKEEEFLAHTIRKEIMGIPLPVMQDAYQGLYLLIHMTQHFMKAGFGLKLLCDWVVFWNGTVAEEAQEKFARLIEESGLGAFSDIVTQCCITYLGLQEEKLLFRKKEDVKCKEFMEDVFEAEEFGKSSADRMVAMRGNGIGDYIREFHRQMKITYPRASGNILLWPALWCMTFTGFIYRNYTRRNVSSLAVLKKAGSRSRMMKELGFFTEEKGDRKK